MSLLTSGNEEKRQSVRQHEGDPLQADYIVVGAGTAGMSFIDSLLTEDSTATVLLVDRNSKAGGHWTTAYSFVRLHQPACSYGVNSLALGKSKDGKGKEKFDIHDRASAQEIVEYYGRVADQFKESGRVQLYFDSEFLEDEDGKHSIKCRSTGRVHRVSCSKVVKVHTNLVVPSMRDGPPFPIDPSVMVAPVNDLPKNMSSGKYSKYIVIGAGKTGCDSVSHLLRNGVDQSCITWIISRDVWYFLRDGYIREGHTYWQDISRLLVPLQKEDSLMDVFLAYEKRGIVGRLDPKNRPCPEVFKGATIDFAELDGLRSIKDIVRMGRVTSITDDTIIMEQGSIPIHSTSDTLVVDCVADTDMSFYGYNFSDDFRIFEAGRINLGPLITVFNPSYSSAIIAYVEANFEDDTEMKNSMLYFPHGKHTKPTPLSFFAMFHAQMKTEESLRKYPPAGKFLLESRTNGDAPHHHGGLLKMLWGVFGPLKIGKKGKGFLKKLESGGFVDCKDSFGNDRPTPEASTLKPKMKSKTTKNVKGHKVEALVPYPPPAKAFSKKFSKKKGFSCCANVEVVQ